MASPGAPDLQKRIRTHVARTVRLFFLVGGAAALAGYATTALRTTSERQPHDVPISSPTPIQCYNSTQHMKKSAPPWMPWRRDRPLPMRLSETDARMPVVCAHEQASRLTKIIRNRTRRQCRLHRHHREGRDWVHVPKDKNHGPETQQWSLVRRTLIADIVVESLGGRSDKDLCK